MEAVDGAFGGDVDFAQIIKTYGKPPGEENPERRYSPAMCSGMEKNPFEARRTCARRVRRTWSHNLTIRMSVRRFTRLTNTFSKKVENHCAMLSLYVLHYNFCGQHKAHRVTPAMEAGIETTFRDAEWIGGRIDARAPKPRRPKTCWKRHTEPLQEDISK